MKKWTALLLALVMIFTMGAAIAEDESADIAFTVNGEGVSAALVMQYAEYQYANGYTETVDYEQAIIGLTENMIVNQKMATMLPTMGAMMTMGFMRTYGK